MSETRTELIRALSDLVSAGGSAERVVDALGAYTDERYSVPNQDAPAPTKPLIRWTDEIEQWCRELTILQQMQDGSSRPLEPLEWAEIQTDAMLTANGTWKPDEQLNWQSRAFRKLWFEQGSLRDEGFHRAYLVYVYYASWAGDHPDWDVPGTAAHTVRLAREAAIEAQREKQGGNPQ